MGYYSEVSIICGRNVARRLVDLELSKAADYKRVYIDGKELVQFHWDFIKWYEDDFKDVDEVMAVVNEFVEMPFDDEVPDDDYCSYLRIGESDEDNASFSNSLYNYQWVDRSIGTNAVLEEYDPVDLERFIQGEA